MLFAALVFLLAFRIVQRIPIAPAATLSPVGRTSRGES
jgi:hypothetical protein